MWFRIGFTVQVGISLVSRGKQNPNLPWYLCIQGYPKKSPWWDGRTFQAYPSESQDSAQAWYPLCYCPSPPTSSSASSRKWFKSRCRPWYFVYWYTWAEFYKTTPSSWRTLRTGSSTHWNVWTGSSNQTHTLTYSTIRVTSVKYQQHHQILLVILRIILS